MYSSSLLTSYCVYVQFLQPNISNKLQTPIPPPRCKIQVYLPCKCKTCPKQVSKGLKYIKWTSQWAEKSGLTLTFEHVTWKSIRDHLLIEGNPWSKFGINQVKGRTILSGQHSGPSRVVWPWSLNMWPENQYGSSTYWGQLLHQD